MMIYLSDDECGSGYKFSSIKDFIEHIQNDLNELEDNGCQSVEFTMNSYLNEENKEESED